MSRILLACGASAAIYKACDLASKLTQEGHAVRAALTENAARLIAPQLFEAISGEPAASSEWGHGRRTAMDHIELARWADLLLVAPASADLIARLAHGLANDLVTTAALALDANKPRLLCPAMNPVMLAAPPVQQNLRQLVSFGWRLVASEEGHMACGENGPGRLAEASVILSAVSGALAGI